MRLPLCLALCLVFAATLAAQDQPQPEAKPSIAELWTTGCLWEVGDNRVTVPKARQALIDAGEPALQYALTRLSAKDTLETRCLSVVFAGWKANRELAPKALQGLVDNIGHADPVARRNVADLLDQFDDRSALEPLLARARTEDNEGVRMAQLAPLAQWKSPDALALLVRASRTGLERLRSRAAVLLANYEEAAALDRLIEMLDDTAFYVADAAAAALRQAGVNARGRCLVELKKALALPPAEQRLQPMRQLIGVVASLAHADTPGVLLAALQHGNAGVRADSAEALAAWKAGAGALDTLTDVARALETALAIETDPFAKAAIAKAQQRLPQGRNNG